MTNGNNHNNVREHRSSQNGDVHVKPTVTLFSFQFMSNNHDSFSRNGGKVILFVCLAMIVTAIAASKKKTLKMKIKLD